MEALKFLKEWKRMCEYYECKRCIGCPLMKNGLCSYDGMPKNYDELEIHDSVVEWSINNPIKTLKDDFFEKFPDAPTLNNGYPTFYPRVIYESSYNNDKTLEECWDTPYDEWESQNV